MGNAPAGDSWKDRGHRGPPPPLQGWSLQVLRCSLGSMGSGPAPGTKMETSAPAKSMCWPAAASLPQPPPGPSLSNRTLPLGAATGQGGQGASPGGQGWRSGQGQWLNIIESSSPRFEPLPYCVTLGQHLDLSGPRVSQLPSGHRAGWGGGDVAWSYLGATSQEAVKEWN